MPEPQERVSVLLPVPTGASSAEIAAWHYDAISQLAYAGAEPVRGPVSLLIELPQEVIFRQPERVNDIAALVKLFLLREQFIDNPASLADICLRQGEHPGIFVSFAPYGRDAFSEEAA